MLDMMLAFSVVLLLLDSYFFCYATFQQWGCVSEISDRLLINIQKTGVFEHRLTMKGFSLLLLILSLMGGFGRKSLHATYASCCWIIGTGCMLYFGSCLLPDTTWYMLVTGIGYIFILVGITRLTRVIPSPFRGSDPFGEQQAGFPQERRRITSTFGVNLPARYTYKKKERGSWINIVNARRGILVLGSPGSGKSRFIIEPIIRQLMEKGMAIFLFDLKYDSQSRQAYNLFLQHRKHYPPGTQFYCINFTDLARSHRCNLLEPVTMQWLSDAVGASRTILLSMNRIWARQQGEFFVESAVNFLAALIWFLRKYEGGRFCTLPHVIELAQVEYHKLFSVLSIEPEVQVLVNPFIETYKNGTLKMLDGQVSGARIPLGRLASPDVYYILTGNDFTLDINDPATPRIFCLGGDISRQEALSPIISLYIDRLNRLVNRAGRYPCALVCDEFATLRAYSMAETIATARSNNIVPVLAIQDVNQLYTRYSREEADAILNIAGNVLCGQAGGETARWMSERFPKVQKEKTSVSTGSLDTSISRALQWEPMVTPATIANLSSGEFVGVVADDPDVPVELKAFHAKVRREDEEVLGNEPLPVVFSSPGEELSTAIQQVFEGVKLDIRKMVDEEMRKMAADDNLVGLVLKSRSIEL
jgi:hypothetical protein